MTGRSIFVDVIRILTSGPGDVSGLTQLIEAGRIIPTSILAILGKTEGNGGVNDFTREYAVAALCSALAPHLATSPLGVEERIAFVMSGGTEGVLSPHITVFTRSISADDTLPFATSDKRLSIGIAHTRDFLPEEIGSTAQVVETAAAVRIAMTDARIEDPQDVHFVQVKCPLLTSERMVEAQNRSELTVTSNAYTSMAYSRGASALGVAKALGEICVDIADDHILGAKNLYSSVASISAGIELMHNVVIVMGNSNYATSSLVIGHDVMKDSIDYAAIAGALQSVGLRVNGVDHPSKSRRLVNVFAKAEASPDGLVRGCRHTMLNDTDISATRHARAAVGGLVSGIAGTGAVYVSGGAEHQGPPGGGPVAAIARLPFDELP